MLTIRTRIRNSFTADVQEFLVDMSDHKAATLVEMNFQASWAPLFSRRHREVTGRSGGLSFFGGSYV